VVERPCVSNRCLYTHCYWRLMLDKMETERGHLGGPVEHSEGKGGECCGYFKVSMWYPPSVSVKDREVGTGEQVLNVLIACQ
jgi:hypothetical protein